jgi:hypothetical protein
MKPERPLALADSCPSLSERSHLSLACAGAQVAPDWKSLDWTSVALQGVCVIAGCRKLTRRCYFSLTMSRSRVRRMAVVRSTSLGVIRSI